MPSSGRSRPTSANDGSVSPIAEMAFATGSSRGSWITSTARAMASTVATSTHWITRLACWKVL